MNTPIPPSPPAWMLRLFRWFCHPDYAEDIEGDLLERYASMTEDIEIKKAQRLFLKEVLLLVRLNLIRPFNRKYIHIPYSMFRHNLLISYRGFIRNKTSFLINLIGLSTGLAGALLIFFWVHDELSIDSFHEKDEQLYQVLENYPIQQGIITFGATPVNLGREWMREMPEVELAAVMSREGRAGTLSYEEKETKEEAVFASEDFFNVFSYPLLAGNKELVLKDKSSIVISESLAKKLFHSAADALGKTIEWEHEFFQGPFQISGVFEDISAQSTSQFDLVFHHEIYIDMDEESGKWYSNAGANFLVLKKGIDIDQFNEKIADYLQDKTHWKENSVVFVQRYSDMYLRGEYENGVLVGGRITYVYLFSLIALFILLIACINFMNLSTAQASKRMKEIGVKKAIGGSRKSLVGLFLSESLLMALMAFICALLLIGLLLPQFNEITGKALSLNMDAHIFLAGLGIVVIAGLLAGSYPAFYLSSFDPIMVLKGNRSASSGEQWIRKGLVIFQFVMSVIFIVSVLVINRQMDYTQTKKLGYNRDQVLRFNRGEFEEDPLLFISELEKISGVVLASNMNGNILSGFDAQSGYVWTGEISDEAYLFKAPQIGYNVIEILDIEMLMGRSFSKEKGDDRFKIILNESALALMQLKDPIGTILDKNVGTGREHREIIGVIKDFQYGSMHEKTGPLILRFRPAGRQILVKIQAGTEKETLQQIERIYKEFHPEEVFGYTFLDEDYQTLYVSEQRVAVLSSYFAALAIIISCLGLFGLAYFTAEQRSKEISIRKILGASVWEIVYLLSRNFTKMVLIAILIALPISYLIAQRWLQTFAYKIDLTWWLFALAAVSALIIAWLTVGVQTFRAARANPTESIRGE